MAPLPNSKCELIDRFTMKTRWGMQTAWFGFMAVGALAIFRQNTVWALLYISGCLLALALIVLPSVCAHCPYPSEFYTCLFLPPKFVNRFYPYKGPDISTAGKWTSAVAIAAIVIMPHFWLVQTPLLLLLYWGFCLPAMAAFPIHFCKHCRHFKCPMNRTGWQRK